MVRHRFITQNGPLYKTENVRASVSSIDFGKCPPNTTVRRDFLIEKQGEGYSGPLSVVATRSNFIADLDERNMFPFKVTVEFSTYLGGYSRVGKNTAEVVIQMGEVQIRIPVEGEIVSSSAEKT